MKIELKKVNEPDGHSWFGVWVDGDCLSPTYGDNVEAATRAYNHIVELQQTPKPRYELIECTEINML